MTDEQVITAHSLPFPLEFSKEYHSQFGTIRYLQQQFQLDGVCRYSFSSKYNTLCIKLSEKS